MDFFDSILCLDYLLDHVFKKKLEAMQWEELKNKLAVCQMTLNSSAGNETGLEEDERMLIEQQLEYVQTIVNVHPQDLYSKASATGVLSKSFYLHDGIGTVQYDRVIGNTSFQVRGKSYISDSRKVQSRPPLFVLRSVQIVQVPEFQYHVAQQEWCSYPKVDHDSEWLIVNYLIPGSSCVQVVALYSATASTLSRMKNYVSVPSTPESSAKLQRDVIADEEKAWIRCMMRFWDGNDDFCNDRFKLIPAIVEGNWTIKMAVGNKPALTGRKVNQQYHRGKGYFEVDIDISSSSVAVGILGMVRGVSKGMVVDLGITIQGENEQELPEAVLCQTRFDRVDLESAVPV